MISQIQVGNNTYDIGSIELIYGTQASATNVWTGVTQSSSLEAGKVIAYVLPYDGTSSYATLNLTLSGGSSSGAKSIGMDGAGVTDEFKAYAVILMLYDGTAWQVLRNAPFSLPPYTVADIGKSLSIIEDTLNPALGTFIPEQEVELVSDDRFGAVASLSNISVSPTFFGNGDDCYLTVYYEDGTTYTATLDWLDYGSVQGFYTNGFNIVYDDGLGGIGWRFITSDRDRAGLTATVSATAVVPSAKLAWVEQSGGEVVTTSANFVDSVSATTTTINTVMQVNGTELVIGSATIVNGITSTVSSAVTAVANDANIANAYGEYF